MSYCVNCGVKLKPSELKCPLCGTPVLNNYIQVDSTVPAYPDKIEKPRQINVKNLSILIVNILLILAAICVLCDFLTSHRISWSIYVFYSILYLCCQVTFIMKKEYVSSLIIELLASELFIMSIALLSDGLHWYLSFAMPLIAISWLYIFICYLLIRRKSKNNVRTVAICLFLCSLVLIWIDGGLHLKNTESFMLSWSLYAVLPISVISIIIYILSYFKRLESEIKQRIFI